MSAAERVNILLVDDQPARLLSYETILESLGQNLVRAHSGLEALEKLMSDDYAVVLLDVSMPGMDGFETASLIHEHPRYKRRPSFSLRACMSRSLTGSRATNWARWIMFISPWSRRFSAARSKCSSSCIPSVASCKR